MLQDIGFADIEVSSRYDTFGEARGEDKARMFEVFGYTFMARKPL